MTSNVVPLPSPGPAPKGKWRLVPVEGCAGLYMSSVSGRYFIRRGVRGGNDKLPILPPLRAAASPGAKMRSLYLSPPNSRRIKYLPLTKLM